jgi:acyl-CoA thioesterase-2
MSRYEITSFVQLMELDERRADSFVGVGPDYPWERVYGGQVVAQALRAAAFTVPDGFRPHSLHAFFIRGGDADEPIRYDVDRLRDGRSFATRQVVALQSGGAILNLSASFQVDEPDAADVPVVVPDPPVPMPEDLPETASWGPLLQRRVVPDPGGGREAAWLRLVDDLGDDPVLQACGLAYLSDDIPLDAARAHHPVIGGPDVDVPHLFASLDHALWFHRSVRADRWHLHDLRGLGLVGNRGLAVGQVFDADGLHVATIAQEALLRVRRP